MVMANSEEKPLAWLGSSKKDLMALPIGIRKFFGHALDFAQRGERHDAAKILKGFGARVYWRSWVMTKAARIEWYTPSSSGRRFACCMCSIKRARAASQPQSQIWTSSANA